MAGIGFALRDLMRKDALWSLVESQLHGLVAVAGPWFFTIAAMALPARMFGQDGASATSGFVTLLMYVFSASLVVTSPIAIGLSRSVADSLYRNDTGQVAAAFSGAVLLGLASLVPVGLVASRLLDLPHDTRLLALLAYGLVTVNWLAVPLLSALKRFRALTLAYAVGTLVFWLAIRGPGQPDTARLLAGFDLGLAVTNAGVCGLVLHEFPGKSGPISSILQTLQRHAVLALGGLCYGAGIWVDKWLMWAAPEHVRVPGGLWAHPTYDTACFVAYLTTVPALALFVIKSETAFHEACQRLYQAIVHHAPHDRLEEARRHVAAVLVACGRDVLLLQLCVTLAAVLLPTVVLDLAGAPQSGVFVFRFLAIGAAFQSGVLMLTIVLHYFDSQRPVLLLNVTFLLANLAFTWLGLKLGLRWYGVGYFLASLVTFTGAWLLVQRDLRDLLYLAFVRQNAALTTDRPAAGATTLRFDARTSPGPLDRATAKP